LSVSFKPERQKFMSQKPTVLSGIPSSTFLSSLASMGPKTKSKDVGSKIASRMTSRQGSFNSNTTPLEQRTGVVNSRPSTSSSTKSGAGIRPSHGQDNKEVMIDRAFCF
jgi:hypothetical protein